MFKQMPLILSILATTSSAQLANAPERVREAKNDAIASSNSEFGRRSPSVNLRKNGRVLQQTMSMEMETDVGELAYDPNDPDLVDCDIGNQDICAPGEECLIPGLGLLCNPIATVPFFCEGKCVRVPPPLIAVRNLASVICSPHCVPNPVTRLSSLSTNQYAATLTSPLPCPLRPYYLPT